jgi:DNA (cytosine-5)-methyltransferase 1
VRFGSVCSGIEAASVAFEPLGWKAAWLSEIDPFACAVLAHRYPDVPNLGDMTKLSDREEYRESEIDILVGGTPCQSFSLAGKRLGLDDPRGKLTLAFCEIAKEKQPPWIVWENVDGVLSSGGGRDFGSFLGALAKCGYGFAYRVLDAQYFGAPQRRRRVFVVGHLGGSGDDCAQRVLFDGEGGFWNAPPRRPAHVFPLECRPDISWEASSGESSSCLRAGARKRHETLLIDGEEFDDLDDPLPMVLLGDPTVPAVDDDHPLVRRLMPLEWERLMGFPDDYTLVPYGGKPAELCADSPRYKALGNSIVVPVLRWIGERIAMVDALPAAELVHPETLTDAELIEKCVQGFRGLRETIPYLREARSRFAQPGRRVPVPGNPTWTEWVETNLNVTVRRVQQLLSEGTKPREIISPSSKQRKLRTGDWRGLLKATERRNAQVFGSVEDPERLAVAIRKFAQGIADQYSQPGGRLAVSVSLKTRN